MTDKIINLNLDLNAPPAILHVTQGDTAWRWHFRLFLDGSRWTIPTGAQIIFKGLKPDGHVFAFSGSVSSNEAVVTSDLQMTICAGEVPCSLLILDANAKRLAFGRITMYVAADAEGQFDVASESALPAYVELLEQYAEVIDIAAGIPDDLPGYIQTNVNAWLVAHPEATTTVQDGAVTKAKLHADLKAEIEGDTAALAAMASASGAEAGKALLAKTVSDGKVIEWKFGDTGVDATLSIAGKAADAKVTGDAVGELKSATSEYNKILYTKGSRISVPGANISNGYFLDGTGLCTRADGYKLLKVEVTPGNLIWICASADTSGVYQFQNAKSVPSSGTNSSLIGSPVNVETDKIVVVPTGATWLIISALSSNSNSGVYTYSNITNYIDDKTQLSKTVWCTWERGSIDSSGERVSNNNRIRTPFLAINSFIGTYVCVKTGFQFFITYYDSQYRFLPEEQTSFSTEPTLIGCDGAYYFKIVLAYTVTQQINIDKADACFLSGNLDLYNIQQSNALRSFYNGKIGHNVAAYANHYEQNAATPVPNEGTIIRIAEYNVAMYNNNSELMIPVNKLHNLKYCLMDADADIVLIDEARQNIDTGKTAKEYIFNPIYPYEYTTVGYEWIYSKTPLEQLQTIVTPEDRKLCICRKTVNGKTLLVVNFHAKPGTTEAARLARETDFAWVMNQLQTIGYDYLIIGGDLNAETNEDYPMLQNFFAAYNLRSANGGYLDFINTWFKNYKARALDYVVTSDNIICNKFKVYADWYDLLYSDHVPIVGEYTLT